VRVHEETLIYQEMQELTRYLEHAFRPHRYTAEINGKKEQREIELALLWGLREWDSYREVAEAAANKGTAWPGLWGVLVREWVEEKGEKKQITWGVVSTGEVKSRSSAFDQWRRRWGVENKGFRVLNQGAWFEKQEWGRSEAAIKTGLSLKLGAYNCYCLVNTQLGEHLAVRGLQSLYQQVLRGRPPDIMVIVGDVYALFPVEEIVMLLGVNVTETLGIRPPSLSP
jgi:hypothetical protein